MELKKKRQKSAKKVGGENRQKKSSPVCNASSNVAPILARAIVCHQAEDLHQAEQLCEKILSINPHHGEALHMLAVILCQRGSQAAAVELFQRAIDENATNALYYYNFGNAYKDLKRFDEAIRCYRRALELKSDYGEALNNMGITFRKQKRYEEAAIVFQQALKINPKYADVYYNLANTLRYLELPKEAVLCYREALNIKPDFPEVYRQLGDMFDKQGQPGEAIRCYERVLELKADNETYWFELAVLYKKQEQIDQAIACYRKVIKLKPELPIPYNNLGNLLRDRAQLEEAEICFRRALELDPNYASAYNNLGNLLEDQGQYDRAEASYRRALEIDPDDAFIHSNLGNTLQKQKRLVEAEASYRWALELDPLLVGGHSNMGSVLIAQGRIGEAESCFRRALELDPNYVKAYSGLLFSLNYDPDKSAEEIFRVYREFDKRFGLPLRKTWRSHANSRDWHRRLKVGYVGPHFFQRSGSTSLEMLLSNHDKKMVEVYAYTDLLGGDDATVTFKNYVDHWVPTKGMTDAELAERVRADGIDILVDLAGHTEGHRLLMFARKPAPVSLHWLDFVYTTGLSAIDYYLGDQTMTPPGCEGLFAETIWRLHNAGTLYRPVPGMGTVNSLPALSRKHVTFGTLTRSIRINHRVIRVWAEILQQVKGSRLVIDSGNFKDENTRKEMAARFAEYGIERKRLEIGFHSPPWDVLRATDITLDCFPHNSGTTLIESLYMGVPFVTLVDRPSVGRIGAAILKTVACPELIAWTEKEYVQIAVNLASNVSQLEMLRNSLRGRVENSPIMNGAIWAREIETAYREMFAIWCKKKQ
jgi:predicted O-linked N-acetylglucosamine transferase (SPINDLY family)